MMPIVSLSFLQKNGKYGNYDIYDIIIDAIFSLILLFNFQQKRMSRLKKHALFLITLVHYNIFLFHRYCV